MSFLSGLFGGSSSHSTNAPVTDTKNTNVQSNTAPVNISQGPQTITTLDGGAVAGALDLAGKSLGTVQATVADLAHTDGQLTLDVIKAYTDANNAALAKTIDAATQQNNSLKDFVTNATQSDSQAISNNLIKYGALAVVAVAVILYAGK